MKLGTQNSALGTPLSRLDFISINIIICRMEVDKFISERGIELIEVRYSTLDSKLRSVSFPSSMLKSFREKGIGIDGSSIGLRDEGNSDMQVKPDLKHYYQDPTSDVPAVIFFGDLYNSKGETRYSGSPRYILQKTVELFKKRGIADEIRILPELEFYIFDDFYIEFSPLFTVVDIKSGSEEGEDNGYHSDFPQDRYKDFRNRLINILNRNGIDIKYGHHEVGSSGQHEIEFVDSEPLEGVEKLLLSKYLIYRMASEMDFKVTFMPKPLDSEPGSGLHFHIMLRNEGESIFYNKDNQDEISDILRYFMAGVLKHGRAISAFSNPSSNSYRRLLSGFEAPSKLFYSRGSRESAIRIPDYCTGEEIDMEYRPPDATCNPYLAVSAILLAGLDGIENHIDGDYSNKDKADNLPRNLHETAVALEDDMKFLTGDDVFPEEIVIKWIESLKEDFLKINSIPTPYEYIKYFSV